MKNTKTLTKVSHTQKETITLSFPSELLANIVSAAESLGMTVGEYLENATREKLNSFFK
jgi:hypothetical protein